MKYVSKEKEMALLKNALLETEMADEERNSIIQILEAGGVRTALKLI